jgi:hypothetical protein
MYARPDYRSTAFLRAFDVRWQTSARRDWRGSLMCADYRTKIVHQAMRAGPNYCTLREAKFKNCAIGANSCPQSFCELSLRWCVDFGCAFSRAGGRSRHRDGAAFLSIQSGGRLLALCRPDQCWRHPLRDDLRRRRERGRHGVQDHVTLSANLTVVVRPTAVAPSSATPGIVRFAGKRRIKVVGVRGFTSSYPREHAIIVSISMPAFSSLRCHVCR